MTKYQSIMKRTKHIVIKHHFIQKVIVDEEMHMSFCKTNDQIVYIFPRQIINLLIFSQIFFLKKFKKLRENFGLQEQYIKIESIK